MLLKYIVSNFKSIGHSIEFSMIPTENNTDKRFLTRLETKYGDIDVLRRGAFFGPNASGKSTFVESIQFAKKYIVDGQKSGKNTRVPQFKGNLDGIEETSLFQFVFYLDKNVFEYGFTLTPKRVSEEWLMIRTDQGFVPMFTRVTDENCITDIEIEAKFGRSNSKDRQLAEVLKSSMKENQKNQLFLYKLKDNGIKKAEKIVGWFENVQVIFPNTKIQWLPIRVKEDSNFREFLSESLSKLDTGVSRISASGAEINFQEFAEKMNLPKELIADIENKESGLISLNGRYFIFFENKNRTSLIQVKFEHSLNNKIASFNIDDESDGTQRLLDLLPILFQMGKKNNTIYFVDEIDRSLHTKLSKYILQTFVENSQNLLSQMIFTAHDVNLINLRDFTKEEIWFIEKNNTGETALKPFSDFETNDNQDIIKDYLNGRFGAIPVIRGDV